MKHSIQAALAFLLSATAAHAGTAPASMLVNPVYDLRDGRQSYLTLTNISPTQSIDVRVVWVSEAGCREYARVVRLAPGDTTVRSASLDLYGPQGAHPQGARQGWCYAYAIRQPGGVEARGTPVAFNQLVGRMLVQDALTLHDYEVAPWAFTSPMAAHAETDVDGDQLLDLDGREYERAPDSVYIPRFLGQVGGTAASSDLVLLNLTGGREFDVTASLAVFNDDGAYFDATTSFRCWTRRGLAQYSSAFTNAFLLASNDEPTESFGVRESGWFRIDGVHAQTSQDSEANPVILAALIEGTRGVLGGSPPANATEQHSVQVQPYALGEQSNGSLLGRGLIYH